MDLKFKYMLMLVIALLILPYLNTVIVNATWQQDIDSGEYTSVTAIAYLDSTGRYGWARGAANNFGDKHSAWTYFKFDADGAVFYSNVVLLHPGESYDTGDIPKPSSTANFFVGASVWTVVVFYDGTEKEDARAWAIANRG